MWVVIKNLNSKKHQATSHNQLGFAEAARNKNKIDHLTL